MPGFVTQAKCRRIPSVEHDHTFKAAGLRLYIWTVDDPAEAVRLKALGADGITTNRPGRLKSLATG